MKLRVDFHGYTQEECIEELDSLINRCFTQKVDHLEIIHGRGTGTLKNCIINYLKKADLNLEYREDMNNPGKLDIYFQH